LVVTLSKNWLTARAEASRARIVSLRESPIRWPRIDDPVGLRLDIELEHTMSPRGILYPPQVRMDGPEVPSPKGYFGTRGRSALGVSPWRQPDAAPPPSPARLVYELYPPAVMLLSAGEWICLEESPILDVPCTDGGYHLGAIWFAARAAGASVDLSELLTRALREASSFEGRPSTWCAMLERLTPAGLEAAGYRRCTVWWKQSEIESCYCVPRRAAPRLKGCRHSTSIPRRACNARFAGAYCRGTLRQDQDRPALVSRLPTRVRPSDPEFRANADHMEGLVERLRAARARAALGGPEEARRRHTARGKLLPRE